MDENGAPSGDVVVVVLTTQTANEVRRVAVEQGIRFDDALARAIRQYVEGHDRQNGLELWPPKLLPKD